MEGGREERELGSCSACFWRVQPRAGATEIDVV
jgi:hypothetical protein